MKYNYIIFYFSLLLFSNCSPLSEKVEKIDEITFNVGFSTLSKYTGILSKDTNFGELIYFADPVTNKIIKFFTLRGELVDSIPLNEALKYIHEIDGIAILSKDTIIINSQYTNQIVAINSKGNVWYNIEFGQINDTTHNVYEIYSSAMSNFLKNSNLLIYNCSFRSNTNDKLLGLEPSTQIDYLKYYYNKSYDSPYFVKITNFFTQKPKMEFFLPKTFEKKTDSAMIFVEPAFYKVENNFIYLFSTYSDNIYIVNTKNFSVEKKIKISSNYTNVGVKPLPINENNINSMQEIINENAKLKGHINRCFYNSIEKKHYVVVFHELISQTQKLKQGLFRPFSVIVFNELFIKENEYIFSEDLYKGGYSILTSHGLMFQKKNTNNEKVTYSVFCL